MAQLPGEDDTPFSLPDDTPKRMPIDYPELDSGEDVQEVYDEGLEDSVDYDPYGIDDDTAKGKGSIAIEGREYYTTNHELIRRWTSYRYGHPAHIIGTHNGLEPGDLYIAFEDHEPDIAVEPIGWEEFYKIFDCNNLAFLYRSKTSNGSQSKFYKFVGRMDVARTTNARRVV